MIEKRTICRKLREKRDCLLQEKQIGIYIIVPGDCYRFSAH